MKLEGSVALVTGANRGLGRALVEELLARGARHVYATSRDGASHPDPRVTAVRLDITDPAQVRAAATVARDVELLVNNAGALNAGSILQCEPAQLQRDLDVNVHGMLAVTRALLPALEAAPEAAIVNILSFVSLASLPPVGGYAASKAAAWSVTQALRAELRGRGIRVHGAFPGLIDTDMVRAFELPKTPADVVARAVLDGVAADQEDIATDPMSLEALAMFARDPRALERHHAGAAA
jgi:NAD(P)-dependent dehydrogenase (short-subunit alcohol dehydrogenase family)